MHLQWILFGSCIDNPFGQAGFAQLALALLEFRSAFLPCF